MDDDRLTKIEMAIAHQEQRLDDLSDMTTQQWEMIERLRRQLDHALQRIGDYEAQANDAQGKPGLTSAEVAAMNKPPHY